MANQSTTIVAPMTENRVASKAVSALKWLRTPRAACPTMIAISTADAVTITQPVRCRARSRSRPSSHASVPAYATNEMANFSGLSQSGAPSSTRSSTTASTASTGVRTAMATANANRPRCPRRASARTEVMRTP